MSTDTVHATEEHITRNPDTMAIMEAKYSNLHSIVGDRIAMNNHTLPESVAVNVPEKSIMIEGGIGIDATLHTLGGKHGLTVTSNTPSKEDPHRRIHISGKNASSEQMGAFLTEPAIATKLPTQAIQVFTEGLQQSTSSKTII